MLVVMKPDATPRQLEHVVKEFRRLGIQYQMNGDKYPMTIHLVDNGIYIPREQIEELPGIAYISPTEQNFHLVGRTYRREDTVVQIGDLKIGGEQPVVIAGPCAVENEHQIMQIARFVVSQGIQLMRGGAFKPRTSPYSFAGLGEEGLRLLDKARRETGIHIVTEVLDSADVSLVARYADVLQIGSRNMQNYKLLKEVGQTRKPVLLKRGMSAQLSEFLMSAEYIMAEGNDQIILCERGIRTFVEYSRNTLDLNVVPAIKSLSHLPIIVDPSHGTGRSDLIEPMSLAAVAAGADGLIIEVHPDPQKAWSDPQQALSFEQFSTLMKKINSLIEWRLQYAGSPSLP
ncbi:MAG: 3-deoxy-7-phosphoheptulonate synthase [Calditrichia bacterium]